MYWNAMVLTNGLFLFRLWSGSKRRVEEDFSEFYTTARPANPDENTGANRVASSKWWWQDNCIPRIFEQSGNHVVQHLSVLKKMCLAVPHITKPTNEEILRFDGKRLHLKGASALTIYTLEAWKCLPQRFFFRKRVKESLSLGISGPTGCYIATATTAHNIQHVKALLLSRSFCAVRSVYKVVEPYDNRAFKSFWFIYYGDWGLFGQSSLHSTFFCRVLLLGSVSSPLSV